MRLGIDIRNLGKKRTGDETVFLELVKAFQEITILPDTKKEKIMFYLFTDLIDKNKLEKIKQQLNIEHRKDFKIISLKSSNKFIWNFWSLPKYLRNNPIDIYLTQYITPWFVPQKIKIVTIIHDISFNSYPQFIKKTDLFFLKILIPLSLRRADKIIAVSKFTRDEIIRYYKVNPKKIIWIYNAIANNFKQLANGKKDISDENIQRVQKKYNLPQNYILYLGTFQPRKNIPTLIEAFKILKDDPKFKASSLKLVLAGKKGYNYDKKIDQIIRKYQLEKEVIFPGYIEEKDKIIIMASASIFCFPSFYEGFGIPILEALATKVPVIVSDIPPHREIAGEAVLYFNPNDSSELAEKIKTIVSNKQLQKKLADKGIQQINNFSWQKTAKKLLENLRKL